jgi:curved DNA-binding protein CbpA
MPDPTRHAPRQPDADPYKVLQVDPEADPEVIQAAFRRLAQKYHPDLAPGPEAAARMIAINAAWETLRDPARRAAHDRAREDAAHDRARAAAAGDPGPSVARGDHATARPASPAPSAPSGRAVPFGATGSRQPEEFGRGWTSGRSSAGSGYDPSTMRTAEGLGAAGSPPGRPSGSVLNFGRYAGWSLGEIARRDLEYVEWLDRMPIGRPYRDEIDALLRRAGRRRTAGGDDGARRGLFRRR